MQMGMVGLGRMGANMVRRLMRAGHECVVYDVSPDAVATLEGEGRPGAGSLDDFVAALGAAARIWIMVPAAFVDDTIAQLAPLLQAGDTVIDGGNSYYRDDIRRAAALGEQGIHYVDVGTSGGVFGLERGYCLMIGGDDKAVARLDPFFSTLAPGVDAAPRTPGREGDPTPAEQGYLHCGPTGAGHFVKMVHNGIEYGMMAAYAEGLNILERANVGAEQQEHDAETAPLREPEAYQYDLDRRDRRGLAARQRGRLVAARPHRAGAGPGPRARGLLGPRVGLGRGPLDARRRRRGRARPGPHGRLYTRFASRGEDEFADRVLSAMRFGFGGHLEKSAT